MLGMLQPWWRTLVYGKFGGAYWNARGCGSAEVRRHACHLGTDTVMPAGVAFLLEGRWVYLFPTPRSEPGKTLGCVPGVNLGIVREAASSSSLPFLEVLCWG